MEYKTLFQFNSIESVIELQSANNTNQAKQLVSSYVISTLLALRFHDCSTKQIGNEDVEELRIVL
jgi:hypothetical protein